MRLLSSVLLLTSAVTSTFMATSASAESGLIGLVSITAIEPHNVAYAEGVAAGAKELGWTVSVVDTNGSADQANAAIQNFVSRGAIAVVDMVYPYTSLGAGLAVAKDAGVPVVSWSGGLGGTIAAANGSAEPVMALTLDRLLSDLGDQGSILALTYRAGAFCRTSEAMLDAAVAQRPKLSVTKDEVRIPGAFEDGAQYANAWLASHPPGDERLAIWSCWDDPAVGAIGSLRQQGRKDVFVYGSNASPQALEAMRQGYMTASAWQDSRAEGLAMVKTIKSILEAGSSWTPRTVDVPATLVTKDNVEKFIADHPGVLGN